MNEEILDFREQWQENQKRGYRHHLYTEDCAGFFIRLLAMLARASPAETEPLLILTREVMTSYSPTHGGPQPSITFRASY